MTFAGFSHGIKMMVQDYKDLILFNLKYLFNFMPIMLEKVKTLDNQYFYLNMWFVAGPLTAVMCGALAAQIIISAEKLKIWAHGNLFFVALSFYAMMQFVMSVPLLFEIDFVAVKYK